MLTTQSTTSRDLSISVLESDHGARVSLSGRLSIDSSPEVHDRLLAILGRKAPPALTIDLAGLTYMDCSGVATLAESMKVAHARNTSVQFWGLQDRPRYLLEATGLLYLFQTNSRTNGSSASKGL